MNKMDPFASYGCLLCDWNTGLGVESRSWMLLQEHCGWEHPGSPPNATRRVINESELPDPPESESEPKPDLVRHPSHYSSHPSGVETIQITKHESFLRGNALKYILRAPYKGTELQDIEKAIVYLEWERDRLKEATE